MTRPTVEPGMAVWSASRERATATGTEGVGGIVVDVSERLDAETGEVERAFVTVDPYARRTEWPVVRTVAESDVEVVEAVDLSLVVSTWRRLAGQVGYVAGASGTVYRERKGPAVAEEARLCHWARNLMVSVFGPDGVLSAVMDPPRSAPSAPLDSMPVNVSGLVD